MDLENMNIRDPFILNGNGNYYLFGSCGKKLNMKNSFAVSVSDDLKNWSEPKNCVEVPEDFWADKNFWAPEVHYYNGSYYMFASFYNEKLTRATQIFKADEPMGMYKPWSEPITPKDWMCLDGTFYVENGVPYMVFCHEWVQITNGEICYVRLSDDLKRPVGESKKIIKATDASWCRAIDTDEYFGYVTDGPFMHRNSSGRLIMTWSTFGEDGYAVAVAYSDNGLISGKWRVSDIKLFGRDGGHGMIFYDNDGKMYFVLHQPNDPAGEEHPILLPIAETDCEPFLKLI